MNLHDKLQKLSSSTKSTWVEDTGKELAKSGVRLKARKIALRVLQILKQKNITQTELAERMGVSRQQVGKIVKGQENLTLETIDKIEQALDIELITIGQPTASMPTNQDGLKDVPSNIYNAGSIMLIVSAKHVGSLSTIKKARKLNTQLSEWKSESINIFPTNSNKADVDNLHKYMDVLEPHDYSRS